MAFVPIARAAIALVLLAGPARAEGPPQLGNQGRSAFAEYLSARDHRAFAVAPGGGWGWDSGAATRGDAEETALGACRDNSEQTCVLYSVDGTTSFDAKAWARLWGPYADAGTARRAPVGHRRGQAFPDLAFASPEGRKLKLSVLRGKAVVLHFWGSWCGPCRREMPQLQKLYQGLRDHGDIAFVLLQAREEFATSMKWARAQKLDLPFYDSGAAGRDDAWLRTADGSRIADREIAMSFPTTYVVDKHGIVVFSHAGPVADWSEYRDFLLDTARRSGR